VSLVIDSSAALAWVYPEEVGQAILQVLEQVTEEGAWVPQVWRLEIANVLEMGVRRRRHDAAFRDASLADLALLPIQVDPDTQTHAWAATLRLTERHCLTAYDAAYLELALRRGLPLASLDGDLRTAAEAEGVVVLGL
jgi:predicted nucleic acid-binding protein